MKLIKNDLYLLLIDEEAKINVGDKNAIALCRDFDEPYILTLDNVEEEDVEHCDCKIIAYYPLTKEAKELDLPLLPPFRLKDAIFKLAKEYSDKTNKHSSELYPHCDETLEEITINDFIAGYKAAQSKQQEVINFLITLKDSIESFEYSVNQNSYLDEKIDEFIQSLSTQQLPKEFEVDFEYQLPDGTWSLLLNTRRKSVYKHNLAIRLKTIINSDGKEELLGTYKY